MTDEPQVVALSVEANIYMLVDRFGNSLGTGTREVCEVLAKIATVKDVLDNDLPQRPRQSNENVRSAIAI